MREFQFPYFTNFPASWQPNEQQLEGAANLVKSLDLAPHGKEEVLLPDFTPNPVLEVPILLFSHFLVCVLIFSFFIRLHFCVIFSSDFSPRKI